MSNKLSKKNGNQKRPFSVPLTVELKTEIIKKKNETEAKDFLSELIII